MQVLSISPSRSPQKLWLKFTDGTFLPLRADDVYRFRLARGQEVDSVLYQSILDSVAHYLVREYILRQIARSAQSRQPLQQKLKRYSFLLRQKYPLSEDQINSAIATEINSVAASGLLDESEYVSSQLRRFSQKSTAELNYRLQRQGVTSTVPLDRQVETAKVRHLLSRRYSRADLSDYNEKNKLIAKLYRKGFPLDIIKSVIDETIKVG